MVKVTAYPNKTESCLTVTIYSAQIKCNVALQLQHLIYSFGSIKSFNMKEITISDHVKMFLKQNYKINL